MSTEQQGSRRHCYLSVLHIGKSHQEAQDSRHLDTLAEKNYGRHLCLRAAGLDGELEVCFRLLGVFAYLDDAGALHVQQLSRVVRQPGDASACVSPGDVNPLLFFFCCAAAVALRASLGSLAACRRCFSFFLLGAAAAWRRCFCACLRQPGGAIHLFLPPLCVRLVCLYRQQCRVRYKQDNRTYLS
jgi:hypothetical protein